MQRFILPLFIALLAPAGALAQEILLQVEHPKSRRLAIMEDNQKVAYLYLTQAGTVRPARDAVAYSRVPLPRAMDWKKLKETGEPPLLAADIASASAVIAAPQAGEFSFRWSADGHSVALLHHDQPIAMATARDPLGYSKAVAKRSRLANAWSQKRYAELFGDQP